MTEEREDERKFEWQVVWPKIKNGLADGPFETYTEADAWQNKFPTASARIERREIITTYTDWELVKTRNRAEREKK